jgi:hypothetical protein
MTRGYPEVAAATEGPHNASKIYLRPFAVHHPGYRAVVRSLVCLLRPMGGSSLRSE